MSRKGPPELRTSVLLALVIGVASVEAALAAAVLAWPHPRLAPSESALARVALPGFAGRVASVEVRSPDGASVPAAYRDGRIWPLRRLDSGERLTVTVTVRRPGLASWLVGDDDTRAFTVVTPRAQLLRRWLEVLHSRPATATFSIPVSRVKLGGGRPRLIAASSSLPLTARGAGAGSVEVSAAARAWETLPAPTRVTWFPERSAAQVLPSPATTARIRPNAPLELTFSRPVAAVLRSTVPAVRPATAGSWRTIDAHTIEFVPAGFGFAFGSVVHVVLPAAAYVAGGTASARTLTWNVSQGSTLRLQQLLAGLGYMPVRWQERTDPPASSISYQLAASVYAPAGAFSWRFPHTPAPLKQLWQPGRWNEITQAAVMRFETDHGLPVDGAASPALWKALLTATVDGEAPRQGYTYVFVHSTIPESLNLWHNGRVILTSPGNTGIPAAPTEPGTYPVFEHIPVGTMSGTNPDGSHYVDPGIQWISYFHGGDAIHAFPRASYGTPQSLGCVELPLDAAAQVWPYTPVGTLVTIEN